MKLATVDQKKCKGRRFGLDLMMDYGKSVLSNERWVNEMEMGRWGKGSSQ